MHTLDTEFEDLATTGVSFSQGPKRGDRGCAGRALRAGQLRRLPYRLRQDAGRLSRWRYLCGDSVSDTEWAFFTTLVRFDPSTTATPSATSAAS
jgi:hypothetical protein